MFCSFQRPHHFLTAVAEWSELKKPTLTQKTLARPRVWPRSAPMICHGWTTKSLVGICVFWMNEASEYVKRAESSSTRVFMMSFSQAFCPPTRTATQTCYDKWIARSNTRWAQSYDGCGKMGHVVPSPVPPPHIWLSLRSDSAIEHCTVFAILQYQQSEPGYRLLLFPVIMLS